MKNFQMNRVFILLMVAIQSTILSQVDTLWTKTFDGNGYTDYGGSVIQTVDSNYVIAAATSEDSSYQMDGWLIKTDREGNALWDHKWQLSGNDDFYKIRQTSEGGFIIIGSTTSIGEGYSDIWVIKTDSSGNEEWYNTYGDSLMEYGFDVLINDDGGFVLLGITNSYSNDGYEILLIKTDNNSVEEWSQTIGGGISAIGESIVASNDGGYLIIGSITTQNGIFIDTHIYIVKTDNLGNVEWTQTYGGESPSRGNAIINTFDGGYVITGSERIEYYDDVFLLKIDSLGNEVWHYNLESTEHDRGLEVVQTEDSSFVITGTIQQNGNRDLLIIKTDNNGNELWAKTFGGEENEQGNSIIQTKENEFILTGYTESFSNGDADVWLLKVQEDSTFISDSTNYLDYFPLALGNRWQFSAYEVGGVQDTFFIEMNITDHFIDNGIPYYEIEEKKIGNTISYLLFVDSLNQTIFDEYGCIWIDFTDPCHNPNVDTCEYFDHCIIEMDTVTIWEEFGEYIVYDKQNGIFGYENYTLFPGIGPLFHISSAHDSSPTLRKTLIAAEINGVTFGEFVSVEDENPLPQNFKLYQSYPNPFNPTTTIQYELPQWSDVQITIYDLLGREVKKLVSGELESGYHQAIWDGTNDHGTPVSAGVYLYQIRSGNFVQTKKMVLLK